jgi:transcriptional regulator with XRE-family HTH domain
MSIYHKFKHYPNSLRRHRKAAGLRQEEVAKALGLNTTERISKWENGHYVPALQSLFRLAALYCVSPQDLFDEMYRRASESASTSAAPLEASSPAGEYTPRP